MMAGVSNTPPGSQARPAYGRILQLGGESTRGIQPPNGGKELAVRVLYAFRVIKGVVL